MNAVPAGVDPGPREVANVAHSARAELLPILRVVPSTDLWARVTALADATGAPDHVDMRRGSLAAVADLLDAARSELIHLWRDLANDRRHAINGVWSGACESRVNRIATLTLLVGPCRWEDVEPGPLRDGTYRALHAALGIDPGIDEAALSQFLAARDTEQERWRTEIRGESAVTTTGATSRVLPVEWGRLT